MNFICDQCADDARFVAECNAKVADTISRYPKSHYGLKDPEMLPDLLSKDRTLLTNDIRIAEQHANSIPTINSGIVVIRLRRTVKTMTGRLMAKIISNFKINYPNWRHLDLNNIHLEIYEDGVMLTNLPIGYDKSVIIYGANFPSILDNAFTKLRPSLIR